MSDADVGPKGGASRDKFALVLETAAIWRDIVASAGFFAEHIKACRMACEPANDWDRTSTARMEQVAKPRERSHPEPSPPPFAFIEKRMCPDAGMIFFMFQRGLGLATEPERMLDHLDALS